MKYLGIRFNWSLGFKEHTDYITTKAMKGLAAIKMMAATNLVAAACSISGVGLFCDRPCTNNPDTQTHADRKA